MTKHVGIPDKGKKLAADKRGLALPQKSDQLLSFTPGFSPVSKQQVYEPRNRFNGLHSEVTDIEVLCPGEMKTVETVI